MFERTVRRVVESGKAHRWLRPLGLLALLALFGGAALLRGAAGLAARAREAGGRGLAALGELRRDYLEQRARRKAREGGARPVDLPRRPARRALAGALAACLLVTLLPVSALAVEGGEAVTVAAFEALDGAVAEQTVPFGTAREALNLPDTLRAAVYTTVPDTEPVIMEGITWEPDAPYEGAAGSYAFTASAAGYAPAQGVDWPVITVTVEEAAAVPDEIETLCAAIDALPTVEELYENAPGDADPEFNDWVAEVNAKLAEVPTLWERLSALSGDAASMERITEARAEKLAALNELAARLGQRVTLEENCVEVFGSDNQSKGTYATLGDAVSAAASGDTLKLLPGIKMKGDTILTIENKDLTLNLNGMTVTPPLAAGPPAITLTGTASLQVKGPGTLSVGGDVQPKLILNNGSGTVTIKDATLSMSVDRSTILTNNGTGGIIVDGATLSTKGANSCAIDNIDTGKVTISGNAKVTSENTSAGYGTIRLSGVPTGDPKTALEITGGTVENTAQNGYAVYFTDGSGVTSGNLDDYFTHTGGTVGRVYPEAIPTPTVDVVGQNIFANGAPLLLTAGSNNESYTVVYIDKDRSGTVTSEDTIFDPDGNGTAYNGTAAGNDLSAWNVYGGSHDVPLTADTSLTMLGGKVAWLCGGGFATWNASGEKPGWVTGNTSVAVSGGTVTNVYGGSQDDLTAVTGNTSVTVSGGTVTGSVYGGGYGGTVTGDTSVTISGGTVKGNIYGGGNGKTSKVTGLASILVTDGSLGTGYGSGDLYGGALYGVVGSAAIRMTGGSVSSIYGSGREPRNDYAMEGASSIDISGGTVTHDIYTGEKVGGNKTVTVGGGASIGNAASYWGIRINGGSSRVTKGVDSFVIGDNLTGGNGCIVVVLPMGYDVSSNPTIATGAVEGDLAKIKLTGSNADQTIAEGKEAYFENNEIKVREKDTTPTPTTVEGNSLYANGAPLLLVAGSPDTTKTVVYIDKDGSGTVSDGDTIFDPDGEEGTTYDGTTAGNDLSGWFIHGGSYNANVNGATKITMTGGKINCLYGGGRAYSSDADVKGAALTLSGGLVRNYVYGGGSASFSNNASVTGDTSVTLSGDVRVNAFVFGGGDASGTGSTATVTGNAGVTMTGGTVGQSDTSG